MFEDAMGRGQLGRERFPDDAVLADHDHLAWLHVIDILGADQVKRTGLRRKDIRLAAVVFQLAEGQRPEPARVAGDDQTILRQQSQGKSAFEPQ